MLQVSALASREIQAVIIALKEAEPEIRKAVNAQSKKVILPVWRQAIAEATSISGGKNQKARAKVLANTAKVTVGNKGVTLTAATTGKPLSGGLDGKTKWYALEFGADQGTPPHGTQHFQTWQILRNEKPKHHSTARSSKQ